MNTMVVLNDKLYDLEVIFRSVTCATLVVLSGI